MLRRGTGGGVAAGGALGKGCCRRGTGERLLQEGSRGRGLLRRDTEEEVVEEGVAAGIHSKLYMCY